MQVGRRKEIESTPTHEHIAEPAANALYTKNFAVNIKENKKLANLLGPGIPRQLEEA